MSKYNSTYYNSERYYDPTAGAALLSVIRSEKKRYDRVMYDIPDSDKRKDTEFAHIFADYYNRSHGLRKNGKKKRFANYATVYGHIRIYQYCMNHVNDNDFSVDNAVKRLNLESDRKVQQVFNGRGMMGKLIGCYKDWKQTGHFQWERKTNETCT